MATDSDRLFQQAAAVPSSRAAHVNSKSNGLSLYMSEAATRDQRRSPGRADDCSLLTGGRYLSSPPTISGAAAAVSVRRTWERGAGCPTIRPFPRDRGGGSDVKHDRDDIPENCARWSGKWMSFGRFVCELVSL